MRAVSARRVPWVVFAIALVGASAEAPVAAALPPEFPVNTYLTGYQFAAGAARLANGDFIVAWHGFGTGDPSAGAFARRLTPDGVPTGPEFLINTYTTSGQAYPMVAADAAGGFLVVWTSWGEDGSDGGVFARRYDPAGNPGAPFQVNTVTANRQYRPHAAFGPGGEFVVTWSSFQGDGNHFGVMARRYDAGGTPVGGEFQVNTVTGYFQSESEVAIDGAGRFVIVWNSGAANDGDLAGVFGQRYDASGAPSGAEFQVNAYTTGWQSDPALAMDDAGNFVVVWSSNDQDGESLGVFGQRFDAAGVPQGAEFAVNTYTTREQLAPRVALDEQGNFVVTWWSDYQDGSSYGVFARRFSPDGWPLGPEFGLNTYTTGQQWMPALAMKPDGGFLVAWTDGYQAGVNANVYGRIIPDQIFADGFEAGLGAWSAAAIDGGDLSVSGAAALAGSQGLQGVIDDQAGLYVQDDSPEDEGRYRARFWLDPNGFDPGEAAGKRRTRVFIAFEEAPNRRLMAVVLRRISGQYSLRGRARRDDDSQAETPFFDITDAPHAVEVAWSRSGAPGANEGTFQMWIDGALVSTLTGLDNDLSAVDFVRLGALSVKTTATGTMFWDAFDSRRASYMGP